MDPIETHRLLIRDLRPSDSQAMCVLNADEKMMQYMVVPQDQSVAAERARIERHIRHAYRGDGFGIWATVWRETGEMIGRCGLLRLEVDKQDEIELTYQIASARWGRGIATEAAAAICDVAFGRLKITRLIAMVPTGNIASQRVAEKIGMRRERDLIWRDRSFTLYAAHPDSCC